MHSVLWQYSHSVCLRPKTEGGFPGGESFSSATQSGTWACTISLSSHQKLPLLKGKKRILQLCTYLKFMILHHLK